MDLLTASAEVRCALLRIVFDGKGPKSEKLGTNLLGVAQRC